MDINTGGSTIEKDLLQSVLPGNNVAYVFLPYSDHPPRMNCNRAEQQNDISQSISCFSTKDFLKDAKLHIISHHEKPTVKIIHTYTYLTTWLHVDTCTFCN